jgi:four helix bundle protein
MKDFRDLTVWKRAHDLALSVHGATKGFPRDELFGLTAQIRRCSLSVPSNIAEGCGRGTDNELRHFLQVAMGSATELEYQLLFAHDLGILSDENHDRLSERTVQVKQMLSVFILKLKADC